MQAWVMARISEWAKAAIRWFRSRSIVVSLINPYVFLVTDLFQIGQALFLHLHNPAIATDPSPSLLLPATLPPWRCKHVWTYSGHRPADLACTLDKPGHFATLMEIQALRPQLSLNRRKVELTREAYGGFLRIRHRRYGSEPCIRIPDTQSTPRHKGRVGQALGLSGRPHRSFGRLLSL